MIKNKKEVIIKSLLDQVIQINKKYKEFYKQTGKDFNLFKVIERELDERIHQNFIVNLLKYNEVFLKEFIKELNLKKFKWNFKNIKIEKEVVTKNDKRIDIVIEDGKNCIGIEMKTITVDHDCQLENYYNYLNDKCEDKNFKLFYLTLNGDEATEKCAEGKYTPISFLVIYNWIKKCIEISSDIPYLREALIQYKNLLENILNLDPKKETEMVELIDNIDKIKAAHEIYENYNYIWAYKEYQFWVELANHIFDKIEDLEDNDKIENYYSYNDIWIYKNEDELDENEIIKNISENSYRGISFKKQINNKNIFFGIEYNNNDKNCLFWISNNIKLPKNIKMNKNNKSNTYWKYCNTNLRFFKSQNPTFEIFDESKFRKLLKSIENEFIEFIEQIIKVNS